LTKYVGKVKRKRFPHGQEFLKKTGGRQDCTHTITEIQNEGGMKAPNA